MGRHRQRDDGRRNNYGTLTIGSNGPSAATNLAVNGGSTIFTEVNRTGAEPDGQHVLDHRRQRDRQREPDQHHDRLAAAGVVESRLGTSTGKYINITISDTTGTSLAVGENYTFTLVKTSGGINLNGSAAPPVIDTGTAVGSGRLGHHQPVVRGHDVRERITGWAVTNNSGTLQLAVTTAAVPEPEHVLLLCVGALLAGFAVRRRWRVRLASVG